jgi:16S rRNA (guanine527-N7)-methyltransferase
VSHTPFGEKVLARFALRSAVIVPGTVGVAARLAAPVDISDNMLFKLEEYFELLRRWNKRINLTSLPLDGLEDRTIDRLIVEPLIAATFVEDRPASWFDLGSGGGSPAIPLKIVCTAPMLAMVESRERKAAFLREAARAVKLEGVTVVTRRIEALPALLGPSCADLITMRAVRLDDELMLAVLGMLRPHGRLILFAAASDEPPAIGLLHKVATVPLGEQAGSLTVWDA